MRWLAVLLLAIAAPALAAERSFTIDGDAFSQDEIVDARAQPDISGGVSIMLTFAENAASRLRAITARRLEQQLNVVLDGKTISAPTVKEVVEGDSIEIRGDFTLADAETIAKAISGKDPLPESLDD